MKNEHGCALWVPRPERPEAKADGRRPGPAGPDKGPLRQALLEAFWAGRHPAARCSARLAA